MVPAVRVVPRVLAQRHPEVLEGLLVDQQLNVGVGHRTAEVVGRLDLGLNPVPEPEGLSASQLIDRRADVDGELRELVLLEAEELRRADRPPPALVVEGDLILTKGHRLREGKLAPRASEDVQRKLPLIHLAPRACDLVADHLSGGGRIATPVVGAGGDLEVDGLAGAVGGPVRHRVDLPRLMLAGGRRAWSQAKRLTPVHRRGHDEPMVAFPRSRARVDLESGEPLVVGAGDRVTSRVALVEVSHRPEVDAGPGDRRPVPGITNPRQHISRPRLDDDRNVGDEDELACGDAAA